MNNNITLVVGAVDKYSKAWEIFAHGFNKYWEDCPYRKVFITNFKDAPKGFETIKVGEDHSWGETARKGIEQIDSDVIIYLMEDYWITGYVETKTIQEFADIVVKGKADHIRILPPSNSDGDIIPELELKCRYPEDKRLWIFKDDAEYRCSLATAIWNRKIFLKFIKDGMNPWEYEHQAGIASRGNDRHLCVINPGILVWGWRTNPYPKVKNSCITRGKWDISALRYLEVEKITPTFEIIEGAEVKE